MQPLKNLEDAVQVLLIETNAVISYVNAVTTGRHSRWLDRLLVKDNRFSGCRYSTELGQLGAV